MTIITVIVAILSGIVVPIVIEVIKSIDTSKSQNSIDQSESKQNTGTKIQTEEIYSDNNRLNETEQSTTDGDHNIQITGNANKISIIQQAPSNPVTIIPSDNSTPASSLTNLAPVVKTIEIGSSSGLLFDELEIQLFTIQKSYYNIVNFSVIVDGNYYNYREKKSAILLIGKDFILHIEDVGNNYATFKITKNGE